MHRRFCLSLMDLCRGIKPFGGLIAVGMMGLSLNAVSSLTAQDDPLSPSVIAAELTQEAVPAEQEAAAEPAAQEEPQAVQVPAEQVDETKTIEGELAQGDEVGDTGGMYDAHEFEVTDANRRAIVTLNSQVFDTVLVIQGLDADGNPDRLRDWRNDDYGNGSNSQIDVVFPENGRYRVMVMAFDEVQGGPYQLSIRQLTAPVPPPQENLRTEMGSITEDDPILAQLGSNHDTFDIEIAEPKRVTVDVWSEDFDTYVMMQRVDGAGNLDPNLVWSNDDFAGSQQHSRLEIDVAPGTYRIFVAAYTAGGMGNYEMRATSGAIPAGGAPAVPGMVPNANAFAGVAGVGNPLGERIEVGILNRFDRQNAQGNYYDRYEIQAFAGQALQVIASSNEIDTVLKISALDENDNADPSLTWTNDDSDEMPGASMIQINVPFDGTYRIVVSAFAAGQMGRYDLKINQGAAGGGIAAMPVNAGERLEVGNLGAFDATADDGRFYDEYQFEVQAGETVTLDLNSNDFDTLLRILSDDDEFFREENDDYEGSTSRSLIVFSPEQPGIYRARVSSYQAVGATGVYQLIFRPGDARGAVPGADHNHDHDAAPLEAPRAVAPVNREEAGSLEAGDSQLETEEFYDEYTIEGQPGQRVRIDLSSETFDTYLMLYSPADRLIEADDFQGESNRTVLEAVLNENGTHRILVTTYEPEEAGAYQLKIEMTSGGGIDENGLLVADSKFPVDLANTDPLDAEGRNVDTYLFEAEEGDRLSVLMKSDVFDTYMILVAPDGTETPVDDFDGSHAGFNQILTQAGRYTLKATSYQAGGLGRYELSFDLQGKDEPANQGKRVLGVFIGIADYEGTDGDLERCDVDAERLYSMMRDDYGMALDDGVLLVNSDATRQSVRDALERIGSRATADDLLVIFYSGHGGLFDGPKNSADPDGIHETMSLFDGDLVDDHVAELINASSAGLAVLLMDSCYSGGFAKDVVSAPGRMGIFASEEDVLAQVAENFEAGGYLSRFLVDALLDHREDADRNDDRQLGAWELCHYLGERYRDEVRSIEEEEVLEATEPQEGAAEPEAGGAQQAIEEALRRAIGDKKSSMVLSASEDIDPGQDLSFQRLVVDRGGVKTDTVLFVW